MTQDNQVSRLLRMGQESQELYQQTHSLLSWGTISGVDTESITGVNPVTGGALSIPIYIVTLATGVNRTVERIRAAPMSSVGAAKAYTVAVQEYIDTEPGLLPGTRRDIDTPFWRTSGRYRVIVEQEPYDVGDVVIVAVPTAFIGGIAYIVGSVTPSPGIVAPEASFHWDEEPPLELSFTAGEELDMNPLPRAVAAQPEQLAFDYLLEARDGTALPAGLAWDPAERRLTGTPAGAQVARVYTYSATQRGGARYDALTSLWQPVEIQVA